MSELYLYGSPKSEYLTPIEILEDEMLGLFGETNGGSFSEKKEKRSHRISKLDEGLLD